MNMISYVKFVVAIHKKYFPIIKLFLVRVIPVTMIIQLLWIVSLSKFYGILEKIIFIQFQFKYPGFKYLYTRVDLLSYLEYYFLQALSRKLSFTKKKIFHFTWKCKKFL